MRLDPAGGDRALRRAPAASARGAQSQTDKAAAEALFDDGRRLLGGPLPGACPKFAESQRLDPGVGTLLNLGDCYEKNGQAASAWAQFREAAASGAALRTTTRRRARRSTRGGARAEAREADRDGARAADEVPGLEVTRDGAPMGRAVWGTAAPLDPGGTASRRAPRAHKPWSTEVSRRSRAVPPSRSACPASRTWRHRPPCRSAPGATDDPDRPPAEPATARRRRGRTPPRRESGRVRGSRRRPARARRRAQVAPVSSASAWAPSSACRAISKNDESKPHCSAPAAPRRACRARGATPSTPPCLTFAFVIGGAALVGGTLLVITAPSGPSRPRSASPRRRRRWCRLA